MSHQCKVSLSAAAPLQDLTVVTHLIQKSVSCRLTAASSDWLNLSVSVLLDLRETGLSVKVITAMRAAEQQTSEMMMVCLCVPSAVDPCLQDHGGCSMNAVCKRTRPGRRECVCCSGYSGDGLVCVGTLSLSVFSGRC